MVATAVSMLRHVDRPSTADPLGIIAGAGRFPFLVAEGARRGRPAGGDRRPARPGRPGLASAGRSVLLVGRRAAGAVDSALPPERACTRPSWPARSASRTCTARFRLLRYLPDWTSFKLWFFEVADRRNDTILRATADRMQRKGITLINSVQYCRRSSGRRRRADPPAAHRRPSCSDIEFGWRIAKEMGRLDIGQSIAVKEQEVIAVEAIEGTDRMIERAGQLCRHGGWTLIKVAKPDQDLRFDVPTVGPDTIENLHSQRGGKALVVEAGKTLVVDREQLVEAAEHAGIVVVAHEAWDGRRSCPRVESWFTFASLLRA